MKLKSVIIKNGINGLFCQLVLVGGSIEGTFFVFVI